MRSSRISNCLRHLSSVLESSGYAWGSNATCVCNAEAVACQAISGPPSWISSCKSSPSAHFQDVRHFSSIRSWSAVPAVAHSEKTDSGPPINPYQLVVDEVDIVTERLRHSITSDVAVLAKAAEYFFRHGAEGKRVRSTLLLLMASSLSPAPPTPSDLSLDLRPPNIYAPEVRRRQQRIAEIAEMIHVASLLHDDVIDDAATRRGLISLNASVGNKLAILAGDFLLARASVQLAALRDTRIVELLSEVLEHLVAGEIMQSTASPDQLLDLEFYLQKSYFKTGSLMANSCKAVAILAGHESEVCDLAYGYGRHLGLAFQVVDDILDFTSSSSILGKPTCNDLRSGIATAPILYAAQQVPALVPLIQRRFKHDGDSAQAVELLRHTNGLQLAKELAASHAKCAADMIRAMPEAVNKDSEECRRALINMTERVLNRNK